MTAVVPAVGAPPPLPVHPGPVVPVAATPSTPGSPTLARTGFDSSSVLLLAVLLVVLGLSLVRLVPRSTS